MVHGDIDLTENLDFYHDKPVDDKKHLPAIPWKGSCLTVDIDLQTTEIANISINYDNTVTWTTYNATNYSTDIYWSYSTVDNTDYNTIYSYSYQPITTISCTVDSSLLTYTAPQYIEYNGTWGEFSTYPSYKCGKRKEYLKSRPEKDIRSAIKHCHRCNEDRIGDCKCLKKEKDNIAYAIKHSKNVKREREFDKEDEYMECKWSILHSRDHCDEKPYRKKCKIPWLSKLSYRVYNNYIEDLHEEQDYSSYLTNMAWLGIH